MRVDGGLASSQVLELGALNQRRKWLSPRFCFSLPFHFHFSSLFATSPVTLPPPLIFFSAFLAALNVLLASELSLVQFPHVSVTCPFLVHPGSGRFLLVKSSALIMVKKKVSTQFTQIYTIKGPAYCSIFAEMAAG